jgi:hypothetical protein
MSQHNRQTRRRTGSTGGFFGAQQPTPAGARRSRAPAQGGTVPFKTIATVAAKAAVVAALGAIIDMLVNPDGS